MNSKRATKRIREEEKSFSGRCKYIPVRFEFAIPGSHNLKKISPLLECLDDGVILMR